jgi:alkylation response protein AidB-like acyl-CoA dehydrogenase
MTWWTPELVRGDGALDRRATAKSMETFVSAGSAFQWDDPLLLEDQLGEEEKMIRDTARGYAQDRLAPRVQEAYANEHTDRAIFDEMGELGLLGVTLPEQYGGVGANPMSAMDWSRGK